MKVIHILNSLKFSGAEIMYVDAAPIFQAKGCELTVMATADKLGEYATYFEKAGYQVLHLSMPPLKNYLRRIHYYKTIIKLLRKEQYDVVHIHSSAARWGFAFCAWVANIKSIYTFHNVFSSRFLSYPYHYLQRWSAKKVFKCQFQTISDSVHDNELKRYHNETIKVYNWYGNARYYPASEGEKVTVRKELGIGEQTLVLISVGGCSHVKRHTDIIKALPLILKLIPDCLYLHLGKGCSEEEEKQLANDLGVANHIRFCGNQEAVRKHLIASDIYLMPSRFEGIPITTIEAMACKIPAILYDVPGLCDFNKSGKNSVLIAEDYHVLADSVIELFSNKKEATKIAKKAKNFVDSTFSIEDNVHRIYDLYR
ncbi:glycosyltransferase [Flavobacterium cellulosilyticum]|uniref:Glycosyltransferase family 1 protein n=1 Tax=Flavobacterium cellulosilyticum TaxID=2541731 RepID=A0A4V2YYZ0_9FLAO|nr:glycosyltransferase [Flavobacterium cellulosilyticum]TDD95067.1 glycosyltransferase family 1 protein [Flavobacterium cellulosilyticum]